MAPLLALLLSAAPEPSRVELLFGGDVIPHDPVKYVASLRTAKPDPAGAQGWDSFFLPLAGAIQRADLAVINLETPITNNPKAVTAEMLFNAMPALLKGLKAAGISVATFANNHCLDQHPEGIVETRKWISEAGLLTAGCDATEALSWEPLVVEKNGLKVGFLAFTRYLNRLHGPKDPLQPHVPLIRYDDDPLSGPSLTQPDVLPKVRAAAARCDALIVLPHWGDEYATQPRKDDQQLAWQLVEAGAVAVVGTHPHVVQPIQTVVRKEGGEAVVAYSLGNLVHNQDWTDPDSLKRDGLLLRLVLEREGTGPVRITTLEPIPIWTENTLTPKRIIAPVVLDDELGSLKERLQSLDGQTSRASRAEKATLTQRQQLLQRRRESILHQVPLELRAPPAPPASAAAQR